TAILDDDFVSLPMKIQPPLYLLLLGVLAALPVAFHTPVYEGLLYFLLVGHLFALAFALSEAFPVAIKSKRISFGPKAIALGLLRGYVWAAGFFRGLIDTLGDGRQRLTRMSVLQLTSPHQSVFVEAELMEFYEKFPCGGDDEVDDDRLARFPWMEKEFGSEKHAGDLVLDVGCGIGKDMENFVEHNATVVGIDIAERPLLHAKRRLEHANSNGRWHLLRADARFLPFKSAVFDHFHSNGVLHHIANYERALQEIRRSLKEQGSGTVLVYHKRSLMTMLTVLARSVVDQQVLKRSHLGPLRLKESKASESGLAEVFSHPLIQYFPRQTLARKLQEAGFDTLRLRAYDPFFPALRRTRRMTPTFLDDLLGRFLVATVQNNSSLCPTSQAGA
ncbi:MAG: class I SAM-dependent methyltransferase, partial [Thermoplasmata archaeon]